MRCAATGSVGPAVTAHEAAPEPRQRRLAVPRARAPAVRLLTAACDLFFALPADAVEAARDRPLFLRRNAARGNAFLQRLALLQKKCDRSRGGSAPNRGGAGKKRVRKKCGPASSPQKQKAQPKKKRRNAAA